MGTSSLFLKAVSKFDFLLERTRAWQKVVLISYVKSRYRLTDCIGLSWTRTFLFAASWPADSARSKNLRLRIKEVGSSGPQLARNSSAPTFCAGSGLANPTYVGLTERRREGRWQFSDLVVLVEVALAGLNDDLGLKVGVEGRLCLPKGYVGIVVG